MAELLPEYWMSTAKTEEGFSSTSQGATPSHCRQNVSTWLQCYATYVSMMSSESPNGGAGITGLHDLHTVGKPELRRVGMGDPR